MVKRKIFKDEFMYASIIVTLLGTITIIISSYLMTKNSAISYPIEKWIYGCEPVDFFFPLFTVIPFTWVMFFRKKDNFLTYVSLRVEKKKYVLSLIFVGLFAIFLSVFLMYFLSFLFVMVGFEPEQYYSGSLLSENLFGEYMIYNPYLFAFIWCIWKGIMGTLIGGFGFGIAYYCKNFLVVALTPFIYCLLENFITGTLNLAEFSFVTSYIVDRLSANAMRIEYYIFEVILYLIVVSSILFTLHIKKRFEQ